MRILLKFPIRERVEKFMKVLRMYESTCMNPDNVTLLVSIDDDDIYFTDWVIQSIEKVFKHTIICKGKPEGKIAAVNRDMDKAGEWDICVVASDDMIPLVS